MKRWPNWTRWFNGICHREGLQRGVRITARQHGDWCKLTIEIDGVVAISRDDIPDGAMLPLLGYMEKHERLLPFDVSAGVFLNHWKRGINLMEGDGLWVRAIDIEWDTSDEEDAALPPKLPDTDLVFVYGIDDVTEDNSSEIADTLSDKYGFCVNHFNYVIP